jgi:hypothetical protein
MTIVKVYYMLLQLILVNYNLQKKVTKTNLIHHLVTQN